MNGSGERRRVPRELGGLHGTYLLARSRDLGWHDCYLVDLSELGAGARFRGPKPEVGDEVVVRFGGLDGDAPITIRAIVRHSRSDYFGATRVGVEFGALDARQHGALRTLLRSDPRSKLAKRARPSELGIGQKSA